MGFKVGHTLNRGRKYSEAHKQRLRELRLAYAKTPEGIARYAQHASFLTGRKHSTETRRKISEGQLGKVIPVESRLKMSVAAMGRKASEATLAKMSKSRLKEGNPMYRKNHSQFTRSRMAYLAQLHEIFMAPHDVLTRNRRLPKLGGEKHPCWMGGLSYLPYSKEFNDSFKGLIRARDNFTCMKCGITEQQHRAIYNRKLAVHHINYDKQVTTPENCCVLCLRCNFEVNDNRAYWVEFFQSKLNKTQGYLYHQGTELIAALRISKTSKEQQSDP